MADKNMQDIIVRYLQDAIAAENAFESQLEGFSKEGDDTTVQQLFEQHRRETRLQIERLTARLHDLGESPSGMKSFMAHLFSFAPKTASLGHEESERTTQNLMMAYAVENSEVAMYESLATVAEAIGDQKTAFLAREIQQEEQQTAQKVWNHIAPSARRSLEKLTAEITRS
jgi:ferritin-like metal-binding protein YciE